MQIRDAAGSGPADGTIVLDVTPVNDAPSITAPASIGVSEDLPSAITAILFDDVDAGSGSVTATFAVASGTLAATSGGNVAVSGSGSGSLSLSGTLADLNAFIAAGGLSFTTASNATANVTLSVGIDDGGNTGGGALSDATTVTLAVLALNDAPTNSVPGAQAVDQDAVLTFGSGTGNAISIGDVEAGGGSVRVTLSSSNGSISLSGTTGLSFVTGDGSADSSMTFEGSIADINQALNGLTFTPTAGYHGPASLQIVTNDLGLSGSGGALSDSDSIAITVNSLNPEIVGVGTGSPDGVYKAGDTLLLTVTFDQPVTVDSSGGTPTLLLETGSSDRQATYVSGSGSNTLTFSYTVQAGDASADLDYASTAALALNGASIRNASHDDAILTLPGIGGGASLAGQHALVVDGIAASVVSVGVPASGTYVAGQHLDFTVNLSEAVIVDTSGGTPRLAVDIGGSIAWAEYLSGSGSNALTFRLTVASGQLDANGIALGASLDTNGATLRDAAGNAALAPLNGAAATSGVRIDAVAPTVASVSLPAAGHYNAGDLLTFTVNASEAVTVDTTGGTPRIALDIGGNTRYAEYVSGSGSTALVFQYSAQAGDNDADGIAVAGSLQLNGASVRDAAGNDLALALNNAGSGAGVIVDSTAPAASGIVRLDASPSNAGSIRYSVTFDEAVSGVDAADFALVPSGSATGSIASVTRIDARTYSVLIDNLGGSGSLGLQLNANGTGIADAADNPIAGGLTGAAYSIDRDAPGITSVGVPASGTYVAGQHLDFTVNLSEAVIVDTSGGTPRLAVDIGGSIAWAEYLSGSGSNALTFRLTVASGQLDTNGIALGASLDSNGATLRDAAGNDALTPLNGAAATSGVRVDAAAPTASLLRVDASPSSAETLRFVLTFDEAVSGVDLGDFALLATGSAAGTLQAVEQVDARTYRIVVGDVSGSGSLGVSLNAADCGIRDLAGNRLASAPSSERYSIAPAPLGNGDPQLRSEAPANVFSPPGMMPQPAPPAPPAAPFVSPLLPPPLFEARTLGGGMPPVGNIFISNGALAPSFIAQVFGSSNLGGGLGGNGGLGGGFGSGSGFGGGGGGGFGGAFGSSSLAGLFPDHAAPDAGAGGSQSHLGNPGSGPQSTFGAPSLGQQLQDLQETEQQPLRKLAWALGQVVPTATPS